MKKQLYILLALCCWASRAVAQISPDSLVLYLPFDGNANDYSGNNYNGIIYGAKRTEGFNGQHNTAYYFDGTNSIVIPHIPKLEGPIKAFSVLVRLKPTITRSTTQPFYNFLSWQRHGKDENESYQHGKLRIGWSPPNSNYHPNYDFFGYFGDWCTGNVRTSNGFEADTIAANRWQTIALVYNEGNLRVYFNCKVESDWIDNFPHVADLCGTDTMEVLIGSVAPGASVDGFRNFIGKIDEVRMYKRALGDAEVKYFADSICSQVFPPEINLSYKVNACQPNEVSFKDASVAGSAPIGKVVWKINNGDSAEGPIVTYRFKQPGTYAVRMNVYAGQQVYYKDTTLQITAIEARHFITIAQHNILACTGSPPQLKVGGGVAYKWLPCDNLSDCNSPTPIVSGTNNMAYVVAATDKNGCIDTAHINLTFIKDENKVYIPTAFTPNGDSNNDTWGVLSTNPLDAFKLQVYNRWGVSVFFTENQGAKWNGLIKNVKAPPGTYVYVLSYKNGNGCAEQKTNGTVTVIR